MRNKVGNCDSKWNEVGVWASRIKSRKLPKRRGVTPKLLDYGDLLIDVRKGCNLITETKLLICDP